MDPDSRLFIFTVIFLFIASAYFALTETAISAVSRNKIKVRSERGDKRAKRVLYVLDHFDEAITTLLICTNIAHISAASIVTVLVTRARGLNAVTLSTIIFTLVMFFAGEMLPKSIGKKNCENSSLTCCGLLVLLMKILRPLSRLLTLIGGLFGKKEESEEISVTEDELYDIIEDMAEEGSINEEQSELISSALQFDDITASSILTPRVDIVGIDIKSSPEDIYKFVIAKTHSRILVYEDSVDNCVGILQIRKYLKEYIKNGTYPELKSLLAPVIYAHQSTPVDRLLREMSEKKSNMAVITDSYGGTLGLVTVEDILEEIVGEIWDEDDEIKEPIVALTDNVFLVNGDETVQDTFDFIEYEDPERDNEERFTNLLMSDWVYEQFTQIPKKNDFFTYGNLKVTVEEIVKNRIFKLKVERIIPEVAEEEE